MPETLTERLTALVGVVAAVTLVIIALSARTERSAVPFPAAPPADPVSRDVRALPAANRPLRSQARPARTTSVVLTAARGDCWLSLRAGSADGRVLYEGVLVRGRSVRARAPRLWIRLGAGANVDMAVNGNKAAPLDAGTGHVVVGPAGVAPAV